MKKDDLKEYINILVDMEDNIYLQKRLIKNLEAYSMSLGKPKEIIKPFAPILDIVYGENRFAAMLSCLIIGISLCFLGIMLVLVPSMLTLLLLPLGGILVFLGLILLPEQLKRIRRNRQNKLFYEKQMKIYEASIVQYNQILLEDKARIEKEINRKAFINSEIQSAKSRLAESQKQLAVMYSLGVVYPKYRNIVMINSICEYLKSGRCSTLGGPSGAYNLLENEMRLDRIILQLDQVISKLDQIKQNQYMLYSAISQGNQIAHKIAQSTKEISEKLDSIQTQGEDYTQELHNLQATSRLATYNLERINKELHYMNRIQYYSAKYN